MKLNIIRKYSKKTYEEYFNTIGKGNTVLRTYVTTTDQQSQSTQGLVKASQEAHAAQIAQNEAIQATSFSTKALAVADNMLLMWGISEAISLAYNAIDNYIHRTDNLKEAAEEAKSSISNIKSEFDTLKSTTDDVKERFAELAQGVENLGKVNQSRSTLSTDDYDEFLDLSNQLAELFPQLTKGNR